MHDNPVLSVLRSEKPERHPIWMMRQAGRYLPEYLDIRKKAKHFLDFCFTPELATQATLQPLKRFDLDAAIVFSDILVIPYAMGQKVWFETGHGPRLEPLQNQYDIDSLETEKAQNILEPVYEVVSNVVAALDREKVLIGFCGAPWTVASYMIAGQGSTDQASGRLFGLRHPELMDTLLNKLVKVSADHLIAQIRAGAQIVQIFESWAAHLDVTQLQDWVYAPTAKIIDLVKKIYPNVPIIGFPKGLQINLPDYVQSTSITGLGLDYSIDVHKIDALLPKGLPVQGNLNPLRLVAGGGQLDKAIDDILTAFINRPHIFNLGHGIIPQTPISHVEQMIMRIRDTQGRSKYV